MKFDALHAMVRLNFFQGLGYPGDTPMSIRVTLLLSHELQIDMMSEKGGIDLVLRGGVELGCMGQPSISSA